MHMDPKNNDEDIDPKDMEKILENYVEPDASVEYIFIEKVEKQINPINDDQGYIMAFINLFFTGEFKNDDAISFKNILEDELNFSVKDSDFFQNKSVDLTDYKFGLVDNEKNVTVFEVCDEKFYEALKASLRNLMIVGKNFDFERFKHHDIFNEWFDTYSNRI